MHIFSGTNDWRTTCRTYRRFMHNHMVLRPDTFHIPTLPRKAQFKLSHVPSNNPCELQAKARSIYYIEIHSPLTICSFKLYRIHSHLSYYLVIQYIPRNMHTVFALLCFIVVIYWLIFPYPSGLLHWHCGNLTIAPVPAKQPWWIWINTSCEFIMNDCITTTKQNTTKPCAYFLGYTVVQHFYTRASIYTLPKLSLSFCETPPFSVHECLSKLGPNVRVTSAYTMQ